MNHQHRFHLFRPSTWAFIREARQTPGFSLFDWLHGRPWRGAPSQPMPGGFAQLGWSVDTTRLTDGVISARRRAPPAVTFTARLEPAL